MAHTDLTQQYWQAVQGRLVSMLSQEVYHRWFASLKALESEGGVLTLGVDNAFSEVWLAENYLDVLEEMASEVADQAVRVRFRVMSESIPMNMREVDGGAGEVSSGANAGAHSSSSSVRTRQEEVGAAVSWPVLSCKELGFNPKNTFDTFVVGANNNFAYAAAKAVARTPGESYNPLFLYGGVGLGKTHLLHAIGQEVLQLQPRARVAYVSSEQFTSEYISAIQNNQLEPFRQRYRQTDVLLIDDIQFLAGKERIQEEFFHTFNALREVQRQIVLTCDRPANEIKNLEQRLVSRFEWGLVTDLQPPDVEVRVAILRNKMKSMGVELPREVIDFIAHRIRTNIRRLEGALVRVASYISLMPVKELTIEKTEELLKELLSEEGTIAVSIETIQKKVAEHFDIRLADMTSKRRPENIAFPRQIAMFLSRRLTKQSLSAIGEAFGGRDHGTVLHACRLVESRLDLDENIRQTVTGLERQLQR